MMVSKKVKVKVLVLIQLIVHIFFIVTDFLVLLCLYISIAPSLEITYRVTKSSKNTPREIIDKTLRKAFDKWEEQVDVAFIEAPDDNSKVAFIKLLAY